MRVETEEVLRFVKLSEHAYAPTKATPDAAGFDLYSRLRLLSSGPWQSPSQN